LKKITLKITLLNRNEQQITVKLQTHNQQMFANMCCSTMLVNNTSRPTKVCRVFNILCRPTMLAVYEIFIYL